jgi:SAM-dependent methyltransferase
MNLSRAEVTMLACPRCGGPLSREPGGLSCAHCVVVYEEKEGVADLLPWSGRPAIPPRAPVVVASGRASAGEPGAATAGGARPARDWATWGRKLDLFREWRRCTWDGSARAEERGRVARDLASAFFGFLALPEGACVLEIGCGSGDLRRYLSAARYWGLDPLLYAPPEGAQADGAVFLRAVGEHAPLADETFDAVLVCETLDHAQDPRRLLGEARRVLRPGGVLGILQSVRSRGPAAPLLARLRARAGRLKARLLGRRSVEDCETKVHPFERKELVDLVSSVLALDAAHSAGSVVFLKARRPAPGPAGRQEGS